MGCLLRACLLHDYFLKQKSDIIANNNIYPRLLNWPLTPSPSPFFSTFPLTCPEICFQRPRWTQDWRWPSEFVYWMTAVIFCLRVTVNKKWLSQHVKFIPINSMHYHWKPRVASWSCDDDGLAEKLLHLRRTFGASQHRRHRRNWIHVERWQLRFWREDSSHLRLPSVFTQCMNKKYNC